MKRLITVIAIIGMFTGISFAAETVVTTRNIHEPPNLEKMLDQGQRTSFTFMVGSEVSGALSAETGHIVFRAPYGFTLLGLRASVDTAPTADMIIDVNESGATLLGTKLYIQSGSETSTDVYLSTSPTGSEYTLTDYTIADDAEITVDIDSTTGGQGLKLGIYGIVTTIPTNY